MLKVVLEDICKAFLKGHLNEVSFWSWSVDTLKEVIVDILKGIFIDG